VTSGVQCETCRKFGPGPPPEWLFLMSQPTSERDLVAQMLGSVRFEPATFCSLRCVADWAYVHAMTTGAAAGMEPPPRAGTGWPT
jgi:hypothetical protein